MADWLIVLLQIGGYGAVVAVALFTMGKWLLAQITVVLNSYVTAYVQESAKIDARIEHLEKLAEEQARLTRTVESIKDEIAAQRKSHDNRWEFRKDVYVNIINATTKMIDFYVGQHAAAEFNKTPHSITDEDAAKLMEWQEMKTKDFHSAIKMLTTYANLAPLATADSVMAALAQVKTDVFHQMIATPDSGASIIEAKLALERLLTELQSSGRKDLWGTSEPEAKAEAAKQS